MARTHGIHWLAPTIMSASFLAGLAFAVAHHVFYASLSGRLVPTGSYHAVPGISLAKQQVNTAVGTGFALLVRIFLSIALTTAFTQVFWRSISHTRRQPELTEIDWAYDGLRNIFGLVNLRAARKYPSLIFTAFIFW